MATRRGLKWLPAAIADLERLRSFLVERSPEAAARAAGLILQSLRLIQQHPEVGRPVIEPDGYRDLIVPFGARGYVVRYRISADEIVIVRICHGREQRTMS